MSKPDLNTLTGLTATIPEDFRGGAFRIINEDGTEYTAVAIRLEIRADGTKNVFLVVEE